MTARVVDAAREEELLAWEEGDVFVLPVSFAQQRLWLLDQLQPGTFAYNLPVAYRLRGRLDVDALSRALDGVVARHETLRTTFGVEDGEPVQLVAEGAVVPLPVVDLSHLPADAAEAEARTRVEAEGRRPFDLERGPLFRARLFRLAPETHVLVLTMHHIVSDGWSLGVLFRELGALYEAFAAGRPDPLDPLPIQYADFAEWQRGHLVGDTLQRQLDFWTERLRGAPSLLELPADFPRPPRMSHRGAEVKETWPAELAQRLSAFGRGEGGATLFMVAFAAFQALVQRVSGEDDFVVGSPIAGRTRSRTEGLIGFFVNTLALRAEVHGDPTFRALVGRVRATMLDAYNHQDVPFDRLVEALKVERSLAHPPLFQVMFQVQNAGAGALELPGVVIAQEEAEPGLAKFDLSVGLVEGPAGLVAHFRYSTDLFDEGTVRALASAYRGLLEAALAAPDTPLSRLGVPAPSAALPFVRDEVALEAARGTLHGLVARAVETTPDAIALDDGVTAHTYAQLWAAAGRVARRLRALGVGREDRVGIAPERGSEQLAGILGILRAGAAYVPLDPNYPADRLAYMAEDSGLRVVLAHARVAGKVPAAGARTVLLDGCFGEGWDEGAPGFAEDAGPQDLAYVIYTSGSTGRPKGVLVEHRNAAHFVAAQVNAMAVAPGERMLYAAPLGFDASVAEMFMPLAAGATLCVAPPELVPGPEMAAWLAARGVTFLRFSPAALGAMDPAALPALRTVLSGGDACPPDLVARWAPGRRFFNCYGPTETTVRAAVGVCRPDGRQPPIGRPLHDYRAYVLDARGLPVPEGMPGELCIGGPGVTRGYHGKPGLTAERFVPDPFAPEPGARMYRSGDRVRVRPDGDLVFLGRLDEQVKVRGHRIEPGEVEAALRAHPSVRDAAVAALPDATGERVLAGYVVAADAANPPVPADLRAHLRARLPEWMVPTHLAVLDAIPLSPAGKVDRRALPTPAAWAASTERTAPRTGTEREIAALWAELLGVEQPGVEDDFFESGGHSMRATQMVGRIRQAFGVDLPLRALFEEATVAGLAARVDALRGGDTAAEEPIPHAGEGPHPLSFAQERLWFLDQMEPGATHYHMPLALRLRGALDAHALARTLTALVARHEGLRTTFAEVDRRPVQRIGPVPDAVLETEDLAGLSGDEVQAAVEARLLAERETPFDLAAGPLFRARLLRVAADEHLLLLTLHHIVSDGWSNGVLFRELGALYAAFARGEDDPLPPPALRYADVAAWQRAHLTDAHLAEQVAWWKTKLAGIPGLLELPTDRPRPPVQRYRGSFVEARFPREVQDAVVALARAENATPFMALLAAWTLFLHRHTGEEDVVVGTPLANRPRPELEGIVGFFVNTLALRADVSGDPSFRTLLGRVRETAMDAFAHQDVPFERMVEEVQPERSLAYGPVFQVMFALQNADSAPPAMPGLAVERAETDHSAALFDLSLFAKETPDGLRAALQYAEDLFDRKTAARLLDRFGRLLRAAVAHPDAPGGDLPLMADDEARAAAADGPSAVAPDGLSLAGRFAAQAARTPHAEALRFAGESLTYAELDAAGNRLARHLRGLGVGPDVRVGICLDRSVDMAVAVLATLKAGGCYVAMDPNYPEDRLAYMLRESRAAVLVTTAAQAAVLPPHGARVVAVDADRAAVAALPDDPVDDGATPETLAYVLYTSGSTGTPKGVALPQRVLLNLLDWQIDRWGDGATARTLQFASLSFDVSFQELFGTWCTGGALVLVDDDVRRDADRLLGYLRDERIERLFLPFVALQHLAELAESRGVAVPDLRDVITAGEQLQATPQLTAFFRRHPGCTLENQYGPSETHVVSAFRLPADVDAWPLLPPIGAPIAETRLVVLDGRMRPVPPGVAGELFIGGIALARGYLLRPGITAERFVPDPLSGGGARLYRTGDRARLLPSGDLQFLGRIDHQVKVRGYRVELGEVEAVLLQHPTVREAAVVAVGVGPGDRALAAYVSPVPGRECRPPELRAHLKQHLPEFMVPPFFEVMERLPLSPNGKVDRKRLPAPELRPVQGQTLPRTPTEEVVAGIWCEVLRIDWTGTDESFFDLGGHSLKATQVMSRVREVFRVDLPLRALFEGPTVAELAARVDAARRPGDDARLPALRPVPRGGDLPLSFAQQRMWFLARMDGAGAAYHIPLALLLRGPLDAEALERALQEVVARHESLRTVFPVVGNEPVQRILPAAEVPLRTHAWDPAVGRVAVVPFLERLEGVPPADPARPSVVLQALERGPADPLADAVWGFSAFHAQAPFDLEHGPVVRAALLRVTPDEHVLVVTMHHIAGDGWSLGVLTRELTQLYAAFLEGKPSPLPPLEVQYADFAAWQRTHLAGDELDRQTAFWKAHLDGAPAALPLPTDRPRPAVRGFAGALHVGHLGPERSHSLVKLARREGATPFMALMAAFQVLLARYAGEDDVVVGTAIAGRTRAEVEPLVGFFVNTLAVRARLGDDPSFAGALGRVRDTLLEAYAHQEVPFEKLVDELGVERSLSVTPVFQVMFALQNAPMLDLEIPGLHALPLPGTGSQTAKFDLTFTALEQPDGFQYALQYSTELFEAETIRRLSGHLEALIDAVVERPDAPLSTLPLATAEERAAAAAWNAASDRALPAGDTVHGLFEAAAAVHPARIALRGEDRDVTYGELDALANRVARRLRALGVRPEERVAVCTGRTPEMVAALLGVMKAGAAYVPVDPAYPARRIAEMQEDAEVRVAVSQTALLGRLPAALGASVVALDGPDALASESAGPLGIRVDEAQAAYCIFTSGSRGRPKAVVVEHRNAARLLRWMKEAVSDEDRAAVLASTSISFDVSVAELFGTLCWGGTMVLVENALALGALPPEREVRLVSMVPSAAAELLRTYGFPPSVRTVHLGGEALPAGVARGIHALGHVRTLRNLYGPTEDATYSTVAVVEAGTETVLVGRPLPGTRAHVLDRHLHPAPAGVPGELFLAGAGVARGYLGSPALTAERFLPDPFSAVPGARMYRVGDRVRHHPSGELQFGERIDRQVKVRGYRAEPGEVEHALRAHPMVRDAVVDARDDLPAGRGLVAWVVPRFAGEAPDAPSLRAWLRERLPEWLVPAAFAEIDAVPLTPNGKIDRTALPAPDASARAAEAEAGFVEPGSALEEDIAQLWREVLGQDRVGVHDNFFDLGGHSLLLAQVHTRLAERLGRQVPMVTLFKYPTVRTLAAHLGGAADDDRSARKGQERAADRLSLRSRRRERTAR